MPKHFSSAAASAYLTLLRSYGVEVDQKEYDSLTADEPPISKVKEHWSGILQKNTDAKTKGVKDLEPSVAKMLVDAVEDIATKFPTVGEGNVSLREGVVKVGDMKAFKESLALSQAAQPLEIYHDLPISKF